jgi:hypothetical protein
VDRSMIVAVKRKLKTIFLENLRHSLKLDDTGKEGNILLPIVPSDLSLLAFGIPPAREAESAGGMPKVPKGQGLGRLAR